MPAVQTVHLVNPQLSESLLILLSSDPVPLILTGGGHFALSGVKEVAVSEEFLGLGEETTGCQTGQSRADCLTGKYLARALNTCHCAPLNIRSHYDNQVDIML